MSDQETGARGKKKKKKEQRQDLQLSRAEVYRTVQYRYLLSR